MIIPMLAFDRISHCIVSYRFIHLCIMLAFKSN